MLMLHIYLCAKRRNDGCAITVVFSCLRNCSGRKDDDFRDEGREFQHIVHLDLGSDKYQALHCRDDNTDKHQYTKCQLFVL